jgi:hypothetical protein
MNATRTRWFAYVSSLLMLQGYPALATDEVQVRAYVNDTCIIADEPFFIPATANADPADQSTAKFFPLLGLVVGKLAELFINYEIQATADQLRAHGARKDTRYAMTTEMNLYRADFQPAPALSINAKLGCMTIVAANFQPEPADCRANYLPKELAREAMGLPQGQWKTSRSDDSMENQLRRANVCVSGKARAAYEARFEFSNDGTAYRLKDAGYRINSLLTTQDRGATRAVFYTLKISNPSATDQQELLSSAWVNIGTLAAGARSKVSGGDSVPWLKVPPLSIDARRIYEEKTKPQQEVMGEIEALKRAITRDQRILEGLDQRIATASADIAQGLKQERTRIAVQEQAQAAELDARNAEYKDLPHTALEFMPVRIEVAVTESESEKKAQVALAEMFGAKANAPGPVPGNTSSGLVSRSVSVGDVLTEPNAADAASNFERTRAQYFDVWAEIQTSKSSGRSEELQRRFKAAKAAYNEARRSIGLEQLK